MFTFKRLTVDIATKQQVVKTIFFAGKLMTALDDLHNPKCVKSILPLGNKLEQEHQTGSLYRIVLGRYRFSGTDHTLHSFRRKCDKTTLLYLDN